MANIRAIAFLSISLTVVFSKAGQPEIWSYEGYQVIRFNVTSNETLKVLTGLEEQGSWDFWMEPKLNGKADLMVSPDQLLAISEIIRKFNLEHEVLYHSLDKAIAVERKSSLNRFGNEMSWNAYQRLETIYAWMDSLVRTVRLNDTLLRIEVINIGRSYEQRPMKVLKISQQLGRRTGRNRTAAWIDGGIHAREWISPATVTFIANEIVKANLRSEAWASNLDWYIAPCINPDGYEYSHTTDRFWRKTRSLHRNGTSFVDSIVNLCVGTDPNRNWSYEWGGMGASMNPCSNTYRGREASSEVEVKNVQRFILGIADELKLYLSMHSYSQIILLPWGHSYSIPSDYDELLRVARNAAGRLEKVHGTIYRTGATSYILYPAAGGSDDWAKGRAKIKYSYTVELPDRGMYGFLLPATRIIPVGEETLELVKSMAEDIVEVYRKGR